MGLFGRTTTYHITVNVAADHFPLPKTQFFEQYVVPMLQEAEKLGITMEQVTEMIQRRVKVP